MTTQFIGNAEIFLEFFERVKDLPEDTEENRIKLLLSMVAEGHNIAVMQTKRTPDQIAKDYTKHGNVLHFKARKENEDPSAT